MRASSTTALFTVLLALNAVVATTKYHNNDACQPYKSDPFPKATTPEACDRECKKNDSRFSYYDTKGKGGCECSDICPDDADEDGCGWLVVEVNPPPKSTSTSSSSSASTATALTPQASSHARKRRHQAAVAAKSAAENMSNCPSGQTECLGSDGAPSCVDTTTDEHHCGGCPYGSSERGGTTGGTDCTALPGLRRRGPRSLHARCEASQCQVSQCDKNHELARDFTHCPRH